jgi:hypothetical protein
MITELEPRGKTGGTFCEPLKAVIGSRSKRHHRRSVRPSLNCLRSHAPTALKGRRSRAQGASPGLGSSGRQALKGRHRLRRPFRATSKSRTYTQGLLPGLCCAAPAGLDSPQFPVAGPFKCSRIPCAAGFPDSPRMIHQKHFARLLPELSNFASPQAEPEVYPDEIPMTNAENFDSCPHPSFLIQQVGQL